MNDIKTLGGCVRSERKKLGLTQSQLGEYAGTGINFISQLEQGKATVRIDKVLAVLEILSLDLKLVRGGGKIILATDLEES